MAKVVKDIEKCYPGSCEKCHNKAGDLEIQLYSGHVEAFYLRTAPPTGPLLSLTQAGNDEGHGRQEGCVVFRIIMILLLLIVKALYRHLKKVGKCRKIKVK